MFHSLRSVRQVFSRMLVSPLLGFCHGSLTFFFSNFGPNSTTFMLPSLTFPDQVRSSLNGISAASGELKRCYQSISRSFIPLAPSKKDRLMGLCTSTIIQSLNTLPRLVAGNLPREMACSCGTLMILDGRHEESSRISQWQFSDI